MDLAFINLAFINLYKAKSNILDFWKELAILLEAEDNARTGQTSINELLQVKS